MTNERINRAVAEELGYRVVREHESPWFIVFNPNGRCVGSWGAEENAWLNTPPDFCNDHNAAAEIRNGVMPGERTEFIRHLMAILGTESPWAIFNATPRQQAEAFLRMRGKWRDEG